MKQPTSLFIALVICLPAMQATATDIGPLGFGNSSFSEALATDRPDFTEGTLTINPGHLQLEGGYGFLRDDQNGTRAELHALPQLLLRVGLSSELELRLGWEGYLYSEQSEGTSDSVVGFKYRLSQQNGYAPHLSVIGEVSLPTGSDAVTAEDVQPGIKLLWAYDLSRELAIAGNVNFDGPVAEGTRYFETSASLTIARDLFNEVGGYLEYFGFYPNHDAPESASRHLINGGFTFAPLENLQFDVLAGFGINDAAEDFFTGIGFAFRI